MRIADIKLDAELYPREGQDNATVSLYRLAIASLPPILVTQEGWLVDGYHRYLAHVAEGLHEIEAEVIELPREEVLVEAVRCNAKHGKQLTRTEKKNLAVRLYGQMSDGELPILLSVTERTIRTWTADLRKAEDEAKAERIWQAWLACKSTRKIAEAEGVSHPTVLGVVENGKSSEIYQSPPLSLQLYDVWRFTKCAEEYGQANYPGRIPGQIVENLLWYYTQPGDVVLDPMAGGGTTIDVCKGMGRRYLAYDLQPVRPDIAKHDACDPVPLPPSLVNSGTLVNLVFIDPPYWKQRRGDYVAGGLADESLARFYESLLTVIDNAEHVLEPGGHVAVIIGQTQEAMKMTDHAAYLLGTVQMPLVRRFIVPYTTQCHGGAHVESARQNKYALYLYRDLMVWRTE